MGEVVSPLLVLEPSAEAGAAYKTLTRSISTGIITTTAERARNTL